MAKCNKYTVKNKHVARRYHYVQQDAILQEHEFYWIWKKLGSATSLIDYL